MIIEDELEHFVGAYVQRVEQYYMEYASKDSTPTYDIKAIELKTLEDISELIEEVKTSIQLTYGRKAMTSVRSQGNRYEISCS
jgi:hypothetical protein